MRLIKWLGEWFDRITGFKKPDEGPTTFQFVRRSSADERLEALRRE